MKETILLMGGSYFNIRHYLVPVSQLVIFRNNREFGYFVSEIDTGKANLRIKEKELKENLHLYKKVLHQYRKLAVLL